MGSGSSPAANLPINDHGLLFLYPGLDMADWASTERIHADIALTEHQQVVGDLHLQTRVAHHDGPETALEMLNRGDPFFPVTVSDGQVAFVAKSQVAVVTCGPEIGMADPERQGAAKTLSLEVMLAGGSVFRGWATLELPPTRARTLDYLNGPGLFFALQSEGAARFINRTYVRIVRSLD